MIAAKFDLQLAGAALQPIVYVDAMQLPATSGFLGVFNIASEFAIRSSLSQSVLDRELRHTLKQVAPDIVLFGVLPGLAGAWFAARAVKSFLFGVTALDPITEVTVALVLLLVAALAASIPAWRAARVDPMQALRTE